MVGIITGFEYLMFVPGKFKFFYTGPTFETNFWRYLPKDMDITLHLGSMEEMDEMREILRGQGYTTITRLSGPWQDYIGPKKRIYTMDSFSRDIRTSRLPQLYGNIVFGITLNLPGGTEVREFFKVLRDNGYRTLWYCGEQVVLR